MKFFSILLVFTILSGCSLSPPPPKSCIADERGLFPINSEVVTDSEIRAVKKKYKNEINLETVNKLRSK